VSEDLRAEIQSAAAMARRGEIDTASESITAIERKLAASGDDAALAALCSLHAELLLEASERLGYTVPTLELRELALRKATRANNLAEKSTDAELRLRALRAKTDALRVIPGRQQGWREATLSLVAMLERSPGDTRLERAQRWRELGASAVPHDDGFSRADVADAEKGLRRALDISLQLDDGADYAADVAVDLAILLARSGALHAVDEVATKVAAELPPRTIDWIRARAEEWDKTLGGGRVAGGLRLMADRIAVRAREASGPPTVREPPDKSLAVGDRVRHAVYGVGRVVVAPTFKRRFAEVEFADGTTRKLVETALEREM
jgi:hypothetical protein